MIRKPKKQETVPEWTPRSHLIDLSSAPACPTFRKASELLSRIPGGFQRFVIARPDGQFVPVVCLWPTEFTPDVIAGCQREGAYVMVGQSIGLPVYETGERPWARKRDRNESDEAE